MALQRYKYIDINNLSISLTPLCLQHTLQHLQLKASL